MKRQLSIARYFFLNRRERRFHCREGLEDWQHKKVVAHLQQLLPQSAYLRERFQECGIEDWAELPVIGKREMMEHFDTLNTVGISKAAAFDVALRAEETRDFSPRIGPITVGLSSGTTAARGLFLTSPTEQAEWAGTMLAKTLPSSIIKPQKVALFLRANSNLYETINSSRIQFEFFDLLQSVEQHIERLNLYQPNVLVGPPSLLAILAEESKLTIAPDRVYSAAEVLEQPDQGKIEKRFGSPALQIYQATEGFIGISRVTDGRVKLNEDFLVVQKQWVDQEAGRFIPIITDFRRRSQPIIRYRLDDVLVEHKDSTTPYTILERIEGRCDDMLRFGEVRCFPDFVRRAILSASDAITDYRVTQRHTGKLVVSYRGPEHCQQAIVEKIGSLVKRLKAPMPEIEFVPYSQHQSTSGRKLRRIQVEKLDPRGYDQ